MIALVLVLRCAYTDWKMQKIPNKWTLPSIWLGLILNFFLWGVSGLVNSVQGLLLGSVFFLLFVIRALKAGDVKLFMALGAILGWRLNLRIMIGSIFIGGMTGILMMIFYQNGRKRFQRLWIYIRQLFLMRRWERYDPGEEGAAYLCFGICIAAGTILAIGIEIVT